MKKTRKKELVSWFVYVDTAHLKEDHKFKLSIAQPSPTCKCFKLELQDDPLKEVCCWIQIWLNENN